MRSSDLSHRLWQLVLREFAILTPTVQFPVAPRRFQRRQGQHALGRPTHPLVLATPGDRPVVEFLHPRARDPESRPLTLLVVGKEVTSLLQVCDQRRFSQDPYLPSLH